MFSRALRHTDKDGRDYIIKWYLKNTARTKRNNMIGDSPRARL